MATYGPQKFFDVLTYTGSLAAGASVGGSAISLGYTTLRVGVWTSDSTLAACGFRIDQSFNKGANWDHTTASNALANNASSACATTVIGDAVRVSFQLGVTAASRVALHAWLMPQ